MCFLSCADSSINTPLIVDSNAEDIRFNDQLLDSTICRNHLTLPPFDPAQWDFQYLDEDEWGWYFTLLRINWTHNNLLFVKQDTVSRHYSFYQLNLTDAKMDTIAAILAPITTNNQTFPNPARHMVDGGDVSIIYKYADTLHLRYWQHNQQLPQRPQREIATIIDLLETVLIVDFFE